MKPGGHHHRSKSEYRPGNGGRAEELMTMLRRATPERMSTFSDGVFAVLIAVLVLELRAPGLPTYGAG